MCRCSAQFTNVSVCLWRETQLGHKRKTENNTTTATLDDSHHITAHKHCDNKSEHNDKANVAAMMIEAAVAAEVADMQIEMDPMIRSDRASRGFL